MLVSLRRSPIWAPHARDAVVNVPRGAVVPLIGMLLERAEVGASRVNGEADGASWDETIVSAMTEGVAGRVTEFVGYENLEARLRVISFAFGPIQFITLQMAVLSVILLFASFWLGWARAAVEITINLIPTIGFLGTLVGMGDALLVLGGTNLADSVSKAVNLGPIGSRLAVAIDTTKWALCCYIVVSLLVLLRDSAVGSALRESGGRPVHRAKRRVVAWAGKVWGSRRRQPTRLLAEDD